ncbi:hypothetical protein [Ferrimonas lipolytica]|uniref:Uncharacterized protein n=1 Tax=Ferrimonas lipolytica TaxID=2724191 RepID=A0A6H1UF24_9GAMM|nr:hypothetical protein [Ferrimonas lipolytica]QIZ77644.1 hypothetical protein HER31_12520 [Ferrimonas lipolytica]
MAPFSTSAKVNHDCPYRTIAPTTFTCPDVGALMSDRNLGYNLDRSLDRNLGRNSSLEHNRNGTVFNLNEGQSRLPLPQSPLPQQHSPAQT